MTDEGRAERTEGPQSTRSSTISIRLLFALLEAGELSTGELSGVVGMSPSATSHQLKVLRDLGLVRRRREGRRVFYALSDDHLGVLLEEALYHVDHTRLFPERER